jgi:acyl carrier protein
MNEQEATELVIDIICKSRGFDRSLVTPSTRLVDDLGFDSLDASELLAALHRRTGQRLELEDFRPTELETVDQVGKALARQGVAP